MAPVLSCRIFSKFVTVVFVGTALLDDPDPFLVLNNERTQDIRAIKPELRGEWEFLHNDMLGVQMHFPKDIVTTLEIGQRVMVENESMVKELAKLHGTMTDEHATRNVVEDESAKTGDSFVSFVKTTAKLVESKRLCDAVQVGKASLKK